MDPINFDINDALKHYMSDPASISTPEADSALVDCESDPDALSNIALINPVLNPIVDAVAENPDAITRSAYFDSLQFLLKCAPISLPAPDLDNLDSSFPCVTPSPSTDSSRDLRKDPISKLFTKSRYTQFLPTHALSKIFDLIMSGLAAEADAVNHDLDSPEEQDMIAHHKSLLEIYGFLLQWTIACVETKAAEKSSTAPVSRARRGAKAKTTARDKDGSWDSAAQLQSALEVMSKVMKLKLAKIFLTTSERDTFIGLLTRPVYMVLESEQRVKNTTIRMHVFKVLCIAVKHHGHGYGRSHSIRTEQSLLRRDSCPNIHRPEPHLLRAPLRTDGRVPAYPRRAVRLPTVGGRDPEGTKQQGVQLKRHEGPQVRFVLHQQAFRARPPTRHQANDYACEAAGQRGMLRTTAQTPSRTALTPPPVIHIKVLPHRSLRQHDRPSE